MVTSLIKKPGSINAYEDTGGQIPLLKRYISWVHSFFFSPLAKADHIALLTVDE